jgi:hypothetical protein
MSEIAFLVGETVSEVRDDSRIVLRLGEKPRAIGLHRAVHAQEHQGRSRGHRP